MKRTLLAVLLCALPLVASYQPLPHRLASLSPTSLHRAPAPVAATSSDVIVKADYKLAAGFLGTGVAVLVAPWLIGAPAVLLGILFLVQVRVSSALPSVRPSLTLPSLPLSIRPSESGSCLMRIPSR